MSLAERLREIDGIEATAARLDTLAPLPPGQAIERARRLLVSPDDDRADTFPVQALGPLGDAAQAIATGAQVQPTLAAHSLLGAAALLTQRVANVRSLDGSRKPLSLYLLTVGLSGDGKDSADRPALARVADWQRTQGRAYEAAVRDAKRNPDADLPMVPFLLQSDATLEGLRRSFTEGQPAQGLFSTEAGTVLAGHAMTPENRTKTAAGLCALWDRGHLSVARAGAPRVERWGLRLSAHLMLQPAALGGALTDETLAGVGLWPRFLLGWPPALAPRRFKPWRPEHDGAIREYWRRCDELLQATSVSDCDELPTIELAPDAEAWLGRFFERMEIQGRRGALSDIRAFALRATEQACRVAGVLAAFAGEQIITKSRAEAASLIVAHSLETWMRALEGESDKTPEWALALYRWLAGQAEAVGIRDLTKKAPGPIRPATRRDAALGLLAARGLVRITGGMVRALGVDHGRP